MIEFLTNFKIAVDNYTYMLAGVFCRIENIKNICQTKNLLAKYKFVSVINIVMVKKIDIQYIGENVLIENFYFAN